MTLTSYLYRRKALNARWLFWILLNSLCLLANGHLSALALTKLVAQDLRQFSLYTGLTFLVYLIWGWQIKQIAPARERAIQAMNQDMRSDILERLAQTDLATVQNTGSETYTSWLTNDITTINDLGLETLELMLTQALNISFSALSLMAYHPSFAVTVLGLSWLMSVLPKRFDAQLSDQALLFSQKQEELLSAISQTLRAFPLFYSAGRLGELQTRLSQPQKAYGQSRIAYQSHFGRFMAWQNSLSFLSQLTILTQASLLFAWQLVPIGAVSSSPYFASITFAGLTGFFANWAEVKSIRPLWHKFSNLPQVACSDWTLTASQPPQLTTSGVTLELSKDLTLSFSDLVLESGHHYLLTGPSGSGKSTLLGLLAGRIQPSQGLLCLDQVPVTASAIRPLVSFVAQDPFIFDDSLRYNLTLGRQVADQTLIDGLKSLNLLDLYQQLDQGLDSPIGPDSLSSGQAQRLCLLRALLEDRPILLLDEVTANLDQANHDQVSQLLAGLTQKTIVWASHHQAPAPGFQTINLPT